MAALMQAGMLDIELASRVHLGYLANILKNVQQAKRERTASRRYDGHVLYYELYACCFSSLGHFHSLVVTHPLFQALFYCKE